MGHHERRKKSGFLTEEEILAIFFDEFEAELSKYCAAEFDKRLKYVFEVPEILEKAWKMPFKEDKEDFKPILVIFGSNLDLLDGNSRIERDSEAVDEILEFHQWNLRNKMYHKKDWEGE